MAYIAIEFDGIIVEDKYPKLGEFLPNSIEVLKELSNKNKLILVT